MLPLFLTSIDNRVKILPLVDANNYLRGLITSKDILNHMHRSYASLDKRGSLLVGAAVGVKEVRLNMSSAMIFYALFYLLHIFFLSFLIIMILIKGFIERADQLIKAGADTLVIDIAHGHRLIYHPHLLLLLKRR